MTELADPSQSTAEGAEESGAYPLCFRAVDGVMFVIILVITMVLAVARPSYKRHFIEQDPDISHPHLDASIPTSLLIVVAILLPYLLMLAAQFFKQFGQRVTYMTLTQAYFVQGVIAICTTNVLKCIVGRLRPNFLALCDYRGYAEAVKDPSGLLYEQYLNATAPGRPGDFAHCLAEEPDAHLSFPSGHTSSAFSGIGFFGLVLMAAAKRAKLPVSVQMAALLVPLFAAAFIGCTRIREYYHHEDDVLAGAIIGFSAALWGFKALLPPIEDEGKAEREHLP